MVISQLRMVISSLPALGRGQISLYVYINGVSPGPRGLCIAGRSSRYDDSVNKAITLWPRHILSEVVVLKAYILIQPRKTTEAVNINACEQRVV